MFPYRLSGLRPEKTLPKLKRGANILGVYHGDQNLSNRQIIPDVFSARLKYLRKELQLSQEQLGKMIELEGSAIAHFEAGRRKPSFQKIRGLAKALNVTTDFLMCRVGLEGAVAFRHAEKLSGEERAFIQQIINAKTGGN